MTNVPKMLTISIRVAALLIVALTGIICLLAGAKAALAASLKTSTVVEGDSLTLGDLFEGLTAEQSAYILGPAPQPGHDMTLDANTLMRVALALELPWRPSNSAEKIVVHRAATIIGEDIITPIVRDKLSSQGITDKFEISYTAKPQIALPASMSATAEIKSFTFDAAHDTFDAIIAAPSAALTSAEIAVSGKVQRLVSIPVLKDTLKKGDLIGAQDIDWIELDSKTLQQDTILKAENLANMTPRRLILAGKPVRAMDIESPQMVERGDMVTLVFENGAMTLTAQGKSLQDGAKGDIIHVVNLSSSRTLDGMVSGDHEVTVTP